jgi:uncharacterized membrane protein YkvA (DUF1232 family)
MFDWPSYLPIVAGLAGLYALCLAGVAVFGRTPHARALLRFLPDCLVLFSRLMRDPVTGAGRRVALFGLLGYLLSPVDLVPDFLPILGQLDDVLVTVLVLRFVLRGCPMGQLEAHWPGPQRSLALILRCAGR